MQSPRPHPVWDAAEGTELRCFGPHEGSMHGVAFSPNGQRIASGCAGGNVRIWDVLSGDKLLCLRGQDTTFRVAFSADGLRILSGDSHRLQMWDAIQGDCLEVHEGETDLSTVLTNPTFSLPESLLDSLETVIHYPGTCEPVAWFPGHFRSVCTQPDGRILAGYGDYSGYIFLVRLEGDIPVSAQIPAG